MVKYIFYTILLTLSALLLASCRDEFHERRLIADATRIATSDPESTLHLLDSIQLPELLSEQLAADWSMLYARTADSLKRPMPYANQLAIAADYYKRKKQQSQWADALFYLARSYDEAKEYTKAIKTYEEALAVTLRIRDYNRAGYICSYMAILYDVDGNNDAAIEKFKQSNTYFKKAKNWKSYAFGLCNQAHWCLLAEKDSIALHLLHKADSVAHQLQNPEVQAYVYHDLEIFYKGTGNYAQAEKYALKAIQLDSSDLAPHYSSLASIYISMDELEKARIYLQKAQIPTKNEFTPAAINFDYYQLEKKEGNFEKALSYYEQYMAVSDSVDQISQRLNLLEIEKRFEHIELTNENQALRLKNKNLYLGIAGLIILILVVTLINQYIIRRKKSLINRISKELRQKEQTLRQLEEEVKKQPELEDQIRQLKQDIQKRQESLTPAQENQLRSSSIGKRLKKLVQEAKPGSKKPLLSEKDWRAIEEQVLKTYPALHNKLLGHELSIESYRHCYLTLFRLEQKEIAILLQINVDSVYKQRFRAKKGLGLTAKEDDLYQYLIKD